MGSDHESDDRPPASASAPAPGSGAASPSGSGAQDPYAYTLQSNRRATSPKILRDFVACVLNSTGQEELVDAATVCTSELVTNAYLHAEGDSLMLRVLIEPPSLRVLVYDACTALPTAARLPTADRMDGRGLGVVAALSDAWGTADGDPAGRFAKGVWFELAVKGARGVAPETA